MDSFWDGFEKQAKMSASERAAAEDETHEFNKSQTRPSKLMWSGAKNFGGLGAGLGAALGLASEVSGPGGIKAKGIRGLNGALSGGGRGAVVGGVLGAGLGGAAGLYHQNRSKNYLKGVSDKNLARSLKGAREYRKGDRGAMNRAYADTVTGKEKELYEALKAQGMD